MASASPADGSFIPADRRVLLTALHLTDLRNYAALALAVEADAAIVVLTGANGAGKTNLLEAISLLTPGRGLRRASFEEIARAGASSGWAVAATLQCGGVETRLGTGTFGGPVRAEGGGPGGRSVRVNGAAATAESLLDYLRVLWLTPAMDGLFTGPAGDRRRFLDRLVLTVDPGHARRVRDLDRLLTRRNRLLQEGRGAAWLDALERQLAEVAIAVALARGETVGLLGGRIAAQRRESDAFPAGRIALAGAFAQAVATRSAAEAEQWYAETLAGGRDADRAAGRTLEGPHRTDLAVTFVEKDMPAALSSTGEQKALLIGFILAHAEIVAEVSGMSPILLLDEVAAHLDPSRRAALFDRLAALRGQSFLTGADPNLFSDIPAGAVRYRVASGEVDRVG